MLPGSIRIFHRGSQVGSLAQPLLNISTLEVAKRPINPVCLK